MYARKDKPKNGNSRAAANRVNRGKNNIIQGVGFVDKRPEALVQRKLQKMIDSVHKSPPGGETVQRLRGAEGTAQEGDDVAYTLNKEFIEKHVADDAGEAETVTQERINSGSPAGIVNGTAPNSLAKQADWESALDTSNDVVPPEDEWEGCYGDMKQFVNQLTRVEVPGWEAKGTTGNITVKQTTNKIYLGGEWEVKDCTFDTDNEYKDGSGNVTMDISHLTS